MLLFALDNEFLLRTYIIYEVPHITSGAALFWIEAILLPINDPELRSTFSNATTKTNVDIEKSDSTTSLYRNKKNPLIIQHTS